MAKTKNKKSVPIEAVQELADKSPQEASIGGFTDSGNLTIISEDDNKDKPKTQKISVDLNYIRTLRPHIAMPCYGGQLTESTFMSFIKFGNTARQFGIEWSIDTLVNESLISRARNTLTAKFLEETTASHLMFIDADIGWEAWNLLLLLDRRKDMIAGLYPMKSMPLKWVVNGVKNGESDELGLQEVSKAGTGFLLTKRDVFEKMKSHPAVKPYKNDLGLNPKLDKHLMTFFDTAVRQGRYYSEDWTFCANWRDLGGKIFVDKRILLRHAGYFNYCAEANEHLLKEYVKINEISSAKEKKEESSEK